MSLNIKDEKTVDLIDRAAKATGKTKTAVVREAVADYLATVEKPGRSERMKTIAQQAGAMWTEEGKNFDYDAFLYDEDGLPH